MTTDEMPRHAEAAKRLSCKLRSLTTALKDVLEEESGSEVNFILLVHTTTTDSVLQYISTIDCNQSKSLLKELISRWESNRADIPAHFNPDL